MPCNVWTSLPWINPTYAPRVSAAFMIETIAKEGHCRSRDRSLIGPDFVWGNGENARARLGVPLAFSQAIECLFQDGVDLDPSARLRLMHRLHSNVSFISKRMPAV